MQALAIKLADREFTIQPLTVGQVEEIHDILTRQGSKKTANRDIIAAALSEDYPDLNCDAVRKMRLGSVKVVNSVVEQILAFGDFIAQQETSPGEETGA